MFTAGCVPMWGMSQGITSLVAAIVRLPIQMLTSGGGRRHGHGQLGEASSFAPADRSVRVT